MSMSKGFALMLVLVFLTASYIIMAKPLSGATVTENTRVSEPPPPHDEGGCVPQGKFGSRRLDLI
jgi:hypothetical protein